MLCTTQKRNGIWWQLLLAALVAMLGFACGGSGGSGAAPSGGGDTPVAVEIPAVTGFGDITYITAPVVTGVGADLSAKSAVKKSNEKSISMETIFTGTSVNACEVTNVTRGLLENGAHSDLELCVLKNMIAPNMPSGVDITDGSNYDAAAWVRNSQGVSLVKFRFSITKTGAAITEFVMNVCACDNSACQNPTQIEHNEQTFTPSTNAVAISSKSVEGSSYSGTIGLTGILNSSAQYTQKSTAHSSRNVSNSDTTTQKATLVQDSAVGTIDGFQRKAGTFSTTDNRSYGNFVLDYTGDPAADLDLFLYVIDSGASELIDSVLDQTQCWNDNGDVTTYPCSPYSDALQTPIAVTDVPAVTFDSSESVNCSSINPIYTAGSESDPIVIETSVCAGFGRDLDDHMDCFAEVYGQFSVTVSINGITNLSTDKNNPTSVGSTTPTILLTTNFTPNEGTFHTGTLVLQRDPPWQGNHFSSSDFASTNWSSAATASHPEAMVLTLRPTISPLHGPYTFSIGTDLAGINTSHIPAAMTFYITP